MTSLEQIRDLFLRVHGVVFANDKVNVEQVRGVGHKRKCRRGQEENSPSSLSLGLLRSASFLLLLFFFFPALFFQRPLSTRPPCLFPLYLSHSLSDSRSRLSHNTNKNKKTQQTNSSRAVAVAAFAAAAPTRSSKQLRARSSPRAPSSPSPRAPRARASPASEAPTTVNVACDLSAFPDCRFFKVEAVVRPWRLPAVVEALSRAGITGMTAQDVLGAGVQGGKKERYGGTTHGTESLVEKKMLSVVVFRGQVNAVVRIVVEASRTGEIGDGKIFVAPVADVVRVRTAETGDKAERMEGGMSDLLTGMQP